MAQEDKQLLLKVLCDGLPYGLYIMHPIYGEMPVDYGFIGEVVEFETLPKPYLRDMEDMTEVEKQIYDTLIHSTSLAHRNELNIWLNKKHFNWRGLPEDMYIKVTEENNPYKQ